MKYIFFLLFILLFFYFFNLNRNNILMSTHIRSEFILDYQKIVVTYIILHLTLVEYLTFVNLLLDFFLQSTIMLIRAHLIPGQNKVIYLVGD